MINYTTEKVDKNNICFRFTVPKAELRALVESNDTDGKSITSKSEKTRKAFNKIFSDSFLRAASEYSEEIHFPPIITIEQNLPGKDLIFSAKAKIAPECKLCDYKSVFITQEDIKSIEEAVKDIPENDRSSAQRYLFQSALIERIADKSTFDIPESMIMERAKKMALELKRRLEQDQKSIDEYYKGTGTNEKALLKEFSEAAKKQLRSRLTLLAIAHEEGLEATDEEYDAEIKKLSNIYPIPPEKIKKLFSIREASKLRRDIAISKSAEFVAQMVQHQM